MISREIGAKLIPVEVLFVGEDEAVLADQHCHVSEPSRMASNDGDLIQRPKNRNEIIPSCGKENLGRKTVVDGPLPCLCVRIV